MKPYYEDTRAGITIYHGDCREVLPALGAASVDMVFADPPFNVGKKYGAAKDNRIDYYAWCEDWIVACFTTLKDTGTFYLMTISRHLGRKFHMMEQRGVFINQIIWRNVNGAGAPRSFWQSYQPILVYGKTDAYYFNRYAETRQIDTKNLRWGGYSTEPKGQLLDYWDDIPFIYAGSIRHPEAVMIPGTNQKAHPCQMPVRLATRAMRFSSPTDGLIVDPFCGSGTTLRAAKDLGRKAIGIELEEKYIEIAIKRLEQEVLPLEETA